LGRGDRDYAVPAIPQALKKAVAASVQSIPFPGAQHSGAAPAIASELLAQCGVICKFGNS
jgi:hypothetical protein